MLLNSVWTYRVTVPGGVRLHALQSEIGRGTATQRFLLLAGEVWAGQHAGEIHPGAQTETDSSLLVNPPINNLNDVLSFLILDWYLRYVIVAHLARNYVKWECSAMFWTSCKIWVKKVHRWQMPSSMMHLSYFIDSCGFSKRLCLGLRFSDMKCIPKFVYIFLRTV